MSIGMNQDMTRDAPEGQPMRGDPESASNHEVQRRNAADDQDAPMPFAHDEPQATDEADALAGALRQLLASAAPPDSEGVGLFQLVEAFTALRHDVKLQTKAARHVGEQSEAAIGTLHQAAQRFDLAWQRMESQQSGLEQEQRLARPLAQALAELHEAVERVGGELAKARQRAIDHAGSDLADRLGADLRRPRWRGWLTGNGQRRRLHEACRDQARQTLGPIFDNVLEGYQLMRQRLDSALDQQKIRPLQCIGEQADPQTMRVVATVNAPGCPHGQVVEQLRPGYLWGEQVLRTAEVRAASGEEPGAEHDHELQTSTREA